MDNLIKEIEAKIQGVVENLKIELSGIRTGRPHPQLVSDVKVNYMEQVFTVKQLASIGINPPREIVVSAWDIGCIPSLAKSLEMNIPGATVSIDGQHVRVNLPPLSEDRRKELIKTAKVITEERRIKIRGMRDDVNKKIENMKKEKIITEDMNFKGKKKVQDIIDRAGRDIDTMLALKIKDIES